MKQCENGHFYDEARFEACPYCAQATPMQAVPVQVAPPSSKTVAAPMGKTVPVQPMASDSGRTVGVMKKSLGLDPVVGFAVCIEGAMKGESFRLVSGRNFIGRAASMDISLADDDTVSRENHALISYDAKSNSFMLAPGTGRGITYLNGAQIEAAAPLNAYDIIEVGSSKLIFLPLCTERFKWELTTGTGK